MIYVDSPKTYVTPLPYKTWSHLWSDQGDEELHEMASKIGIKRSWFQAKTGPTATERAKRRAHHYDLTPSKRLLAIRLGAVPMEIYEFLEKEEAARRLDQEVLPLPTTPAEIATQAMLTGVGE